MPGSRPEIVSRGEDHVVAIFDDVMIQLWTHAVPLDAARRVNVAADRMAASGKPFSTLIVVAAAAKPPTDQARRLLLSFAQRHAKAMQTCVLVVEGSGLRGAIMRSIMTGMSLLVPQIPVAIVKDLDEGTELLRTPDTHFDRDALKNAVDILRVNNPDPFMPPSARARSTS
jgi:hypothetical protein